MLTNNYRSYSSSNAVNYNSLEVVKNQYDNKIASPESNIFVFRQK